MITLDAMKLIRRSLKAFRGRLLKEPWEKKAFYLMHDYPNEISITKHGVRLNLLGLEIKRKSFYFVLDQYDIIRTLQAVKSARFSIKDGLFFIFINGVALNPTTSEELFIIEEIYVKECYRFCVKHPCIVIDVGMNVGMASLFFASIVEVEKVYAFEPFIPTFEQATVNLGNNSELQRKIVPFLYGLGDKEKKLRLDYHYDFKGQAGIHGTSLIKSGIGAPDDIEISIKDAATELKSIICSHKGKNFILKIDCEGAEYDIIKRLAECKLLSHFKVVIIEWHLHGPMHLVQNLEAFGFLCFYSYSSNHKVGMIYASK